MKTRFRAAVMLITFAVSASGIARPTTKEDRLEDAYDAFQVKIQKLITSAETPKEEIPRLMDIKKSFEVSQAVFETFVTNNCRPILLTGDTWELGQINHRECVRSHYERRTNNLDYASKKLLPAPR